MKFTKIKVGKMYETKVGTGICKKTSNLNKPAVMIDIFHPVPRGTLWMPPRDVLSEVDEKP